jgi:mRNA interferase RelE/StbE
MAKYSVEINKKAQKSLDKLSDFIVAPVLSAINDLAENPRPQGYRKLKGRKGYRIRVGDYRVIYEIFDHVLLIEVVDLGHRKDIYD